jgi:subtilisin family serine protease
MARRWSNVRARVGVGCLTSALAVTVAAVAQDLHTPIDPRIQAELAAGRDRFPVIVNLVGSDATRMPLTTEPALAESVRSRAVAAILDAELADLRGRLADAELATVRRFLLQPGYAATLTRDGLLEVSRRPEVRSIEPDLRLTVHTAEGLAMIGAVHLHELGLTGEGTAVAIIDTGIDPLHPTLGGGAIPNAKVVRGLDTADLDDDPSDCGGHGTAVASVAAGSSYQWNPEQRFAGGVAPQAKILAYKASADADCGSFYLSAVIAAIEDAVVHRVTSDYRLVTINLSLGGGAFEGPCDRFAVSYANAVAAATDAGIAVVASTGNEGLTSAIAVPACTSDAISVASVWDSDSGWIGYSFCLDPDCIARCDDSFRPAGAVSCYSNVATTLDLLAPSEYLRAAAAGGQTVEFGGTSGAAAYVTGAMALLSQAEPELGPGGLRSVMELSGVPTLDPRSGLVRPRIDLERALTLIDHLHPSADPAMPISAAPAAPTVSTVTVDQPGVVGSVRVLLHAVHPAPQRLVITLTGPDGTQVRLHEHGPGTVPGGGDLPHADGVWGLYPDELAPVDSLAVFANHPAAGVWTLELIDSGPPEGAGEVARLAGWALAIEPPQPPDPTSAIAAVVPIVAHSDGAGGTAWRSDVRIFNPSPDASATGRLSFVPSGEDGTEVFLQTEVVLPQRSVLDIPDVVGSRFAGTEMRGSLLLQSDAPGLVVSSRTYTGDHTLGTYGQYIGAADADQSTAAGEPKLVIGELGDGVRFRSNLGITEIAGSEATVTVTRRDGATGLPVATPASFQVAPFSNLQVAIPAGPTAGGYAEIAVTDGDGRVVGYASLVDNLSEDAVFIPARRPAVEDRLVVPVVARQPGHARTQWRSTLAIVNVGGADTTIDLELRPRLGSARLPMFASVDLPAGRQLVVDDVVADLFQLQREVGLLMVEPRGGPASLVVTSRTFNDADSGTFGQLVTTVHSDSGPRAVIPHLDSSRWFRSNIGVAEVAGAAVRVRCTLRDPIGRVLGSSLLLDLEPFQLVQIDDFFAAAGAAPSGNARVELEIDSGAGRFFGYGSVIDRTTGDAIFIPASPLGE